MPAGPVRLVRVGEMFNSCAPARAKSAAACPCELDSQRGVFWMFFVNTRRLHLGLVHLLQSEGRHRLHDALEARAQIQRQPIELHLQDETAPGTGALRTELHGGRRVWQSNTGRVLESLRHPIAIVCSLYCNRGRLGFYCDLET